MVMSCTERNEQPGPGLTQGVSGFVQKGPFISGSNITVQVLDEDFNPTGVSFTVTTIDDFGSFDLESEIEGMYVEFIAQGFYYNEVAGEISSSTLSLRALARVTTDLKSNVNVLTTLSKNRIIELVKNGGKTFDEAKAQAQSEILSNFNISLDGTDFNSMDIGASGEQNAVLLAISSILQGNQTVGQLSELISKIILDVQDNGVIDLATTKDKIKNNAQGLTIGLIKANLANRFSQLGVSATVPDLEKFAKRLVPLTIVNQSPAANESGVRYDLTSIDVYYNKALLASTVNNTSVKLSSVDDNQSIDGQVSYSPGGFKISFVPAGELLPDKTYKLTINNVSTLDGTDFPSSSSTFSTINVDITSNLAAYYPLDGDTNDASGHGLDATAVNTSYTPGISTQALKFPGEGSYLEIPNVMNLTEKVWTYSLWINLDEMPSGVIGFLLATRLSANTFWDVPLYIRPSIASIATYNESAFDLGPNAINTGVWRHVAMVVNNGTVEIYVDGEMKASRKDFWSRQGNTSGQPDFLGDATGSYEYYTGKYYISERFRGEDYPGYLKGSVDNVRFYKRALNKYEVGKLFSEHK